VSELQSFHLKRTSHSASTLRLRAFYALALIVLVSVVLRVAVALWLGNEIDAPPLLTDQRSYNTLGVRLSTGHGFSFDKPWYPFYLPPDSPTAHWSYLYSLFIAGVYYVFGSQVVVARLVQAVLGGILLPVAVYQITRRVIESPSSAHLLAALRERGLNIAALPFIAAGLAAIYFYFVLYAATLMTETFFITAVLWALNRAIALADAPTIKNGLALGAGLAIATLLRQSVLPAIAVILLWILWATWRVQRLRQVMAAITVSGAVLVAAIAPFAIRNYRVFGEFLLLNSNAGYAMYSAQHPMQGTSFQPFAAAPLPVDLVSGNEAQLDRELMKRGIAFVLAEPGRYLMLSLSRIPIYFEFWPSGETSFINNIGRVGSIGLFLPFMIYGLWLALRLSVLEEKRKWSQFFTRPVALLIGFMAFYSVLHIFTWAMPRYRLPVDAAALPFAAIALNDLVCWMTVRRRKKLDTSRSL
jgi:ABC-type multidrug transport system fused ATPase/permease subunit